MAWSHKYFDCKHVQRYKQCVMLQLGIVLVATAVVAQEHAEESHSNHYVPQHGQAFSYSHVIHDHGPSEAHPVGSDYHHSHQPHHYPLFQPYAITVEKHVPYAISYPVAVPVPKPFPVTVHKPYPVTVERPVPVTVERPYPYPVKYPVAVSVPTLVPVAVPKPYPVLVQGHHEHHEDEGSAEYSSLEDDESR